MRNVVLDRTIAIVILCATFGIMAQFQVSASNNSPYLAVQSNYVPGEIYVGNRVVMNLAPTKDYTVGERVALVNRRMNLIVPLQNDLIRANQSQLLLEVAAARSGKSWVPVIGIALPLDYQIPPSITAAEAGNLITKSGNTPRYRFIPIVTVTEADVERNGGKGFQDAFHLAELWQKNIIDAFNGLP